MTHTIDDLRQKADTGGIHDTVPVATIDLRHILNELDRLAWLVGFRCTCHACPTHDR